MVTQPFQPVGHGAPLCATVHTSRANAHKWYDTTYLRRAHSRAAHQLRCVVTVYPHEVAHLALATGCVGDAHGRRMLTQVGAISLRAAVPAEEIARQLQGPVVNLHRIMNGGGLRVRARRPGERRSVPPDCGCTPERQSGLRMTDPLALRPTAGEQVKEDLQ
jgi:hypothetical protein